MHIEKLKYFIDLYECGNYTETAQKNFISQTTISQYIRSLEHTFDTVLFDRKKTPVTPTKSGELFYHEATILYQQYQNMCDTMEHFTHSDKQTLKISYATLVDIDTLLPYTIQFKELHPEYEVILNKLSLKDCSDLLEKGLYDISVAFDSEFAGTTSTQISLYEGSYVAAVGFHHPLFQYDSLPMETLYQYPFIMLDPENIGKSYTLMMDHCKQDGYLPQIAKTVQDLETELFTIVSENLIGFIPDNYDMGQFKDRLKLIRLENSSHKFRIVASYLKNNHNSAIHDFIKLLQSPSS